MEKKELIEIKVKKLLKYYRKALRDNGADNKIAEKIIIKSVFVEIDKAREEGRREGSEITSRYISDFVKSESGKSGRKEILEYIEELSKLKQ